MEPQIIKQKSKWGKYAKILTITIVSFIIIAVFFMWQIVVGIQDIVLDFGF
jgi:hypothetical protein